MQINALDSLDNYPLDEPLDTPGTLKINFMQELTQEAFFYNNQTICANFNNNVQTIQDGQSWSMYKYDTTEKTNENIDCQFNYSFSEP